MATNRRHVHWTRVGRWAQCRGLLLLTCEGANECGRSDEEGDKEEEDDRKKEPREGGLLLLISNRRKEASGGGLRLGLRLHGDRLGRRLHG